MPERAEPSKVNGAGSCFVTTHWTVVLEAALPGQASGHEAFAKLYTDYWPPIYAFVRRRGYSREEAEDLSQDFFQRLLEKQALAGLRRQGGRFRSFLISCLENFLANEWDRSRALKRGGGLAPLPLDASDAESRLCLDGTSGEPPASLFEQEWAYTVIERAMSHLRQECAEDGRTEFFEQIRPHLLGDRQGAPYAQVAARFAMSEGAVKVAVHRLRHRFGQFLRQDIARTVSTSSEIDEELRHLIDVVGR